jgi:hypothetical protein
MAKTVKNVETCNLPKNAMEEIILCNQEIYPNVFKLLQIFATLLISSSSIERTFSNLKKNKDLLTKHNISSKYNLLIVYFIYLKVIYFKFYYRRD